MQSTIPKRVAILIIGLAGFALLIIIQLIAIASGDQETADETVGRDEPLARGNIFDRNQRILAIGTRLDSVAAWIPDVDDPERSTAILSEVLSVNKEELTTRLSGDGYVLIKRYATQEESRRITAYRQDGQLRGIILEPIAGRIYPQRHYASAVIGYSGTDNTGLDGAEYSFDVFLTPDHTQQIYRGHDVFLTIDIVLQSFVDQLAQEAQSTEQADAVMAIVMDAKNGEILASSSIPNYDPNQFTRYSAQQRRNRTILDIYEPGSVFKIFSLAAILEHGSVQEGDYFDTDSGYRGQFEEYEITDLNQYGTISTTEIIKFSSNIGAAIASETIPNESLYTILSEFGFGRATNISLSGEENAIFRQVSEWTERTKPTVAIGQEVAVTAMQMVGAATAIAGDGRVIRPEIVRKIVAPNGEVAYRSQARYVAAPISTETARIMRQMMSIATEPGGTASRIRVDGVTVSAKTGTAEVFDPQTETYSEERFISSALAIVPTEDPQYIIYLVIDYPKVGSIFGGRIAAPRVRSIIEYLISYRGLSTTDNRVTVPNQIYIDP